MPLSILYINWMILSRIFLNFFSKFIPATKVGGDRRIYCNNYFCKNGKANEQTFNEVFYAMNYFSKSEKSGIEKAVEFISK